MVNDVNDKRKWNINKSYFNNNLKSRNEILFINDKRNLIIKQLLKVYLILKVNIMNFYILLIHYLKDINNIDKV